MGSGWRKSGSTRRKSSVSGCRDDPIDELTALCLVTPQEECAASIVPGVPRVAEYGLAELKVGVFFQEPLDKASVFLRLNRASGVDESSSRFYERRHALQ